MLNSEQLTGNDCSNLVAIPSSFFEYCEPNKTHLAQPDALTALLELQKLATLANHPFQIISSYRSFEQQLSIWNRKYRGELNVLDSNENVVDMLSLTPIERIQSILLYSALPGASRHHWGTDFDVFPSSALKAGYKPQLLASEFAQGAIAGEFNEWMLKTLPETAFYRPYERFQGGIAAEAWHLSYEPLAETAMEQLSAETLLDYYHHLANDICVEGKESICDNIINLHQQFITNICR